MGNHQGKKKLKVSEEEESLQEITMLKKRHYPYYEKYVVQLEEKEIVQRAIKKGYIGQNLKGIIRRPEELRPKQIEALVRSAKTIQGFNLSLDGLSEKIPNHKYKKLRQIIKGHRSLRSISLIESFRDKRHDFKELRSSFKGLCGLKHLDLFLKSENHLDKEYCGLGQLFKRFPGLRTVNLTWHEWRGTTAKATKALAKGLKRLQSLENIGFDLSWYQKQVLEGLSQGLKEMRSQTRVTLYFYSMPWRKGEKEGLKAAFEGCEAIRNLRVKFWRTAESYRACSSNPELGLPAFSESFKIFNWLKHLDLTLNDYIRVNTLKFLSESLGELSCLENLKMIFLNCEDRTDSEIVVLSQNIQKLKSLKHLKLIFFNCGKLSDEGLKALGKALNKLTAIETIDLRLLSPEGMKWTKRGFQALNKDPEEAKCLHRTYFLFREALDVGDEETHEVIEYLLLMKSMRETTEDFRNYPILTNEFLNKISQGFKIIPALKKVLLVFRSCDGSNIKESDELDLEGPPFQMLNGDDGVFTIKLRGN